MDLRANNSVVWCVKREMEPFALAHAVGVVPQPIPSSAINSIGGMKRCRGQGQSLRELSM